MGKAKIAEPEYGTFTDERDGQTYKTVKMPDGKVWMAQNLNYKPESGHSCSYGGNMSLHEQYGRLYDWETAKAVSPAGWHLPSVDEWVDLLYAVSGKGLWVEKVPKGTLPSDSIPSYLIMREPAWIGNDVAGGKLKAASGWNDFEGKSGNGTDDFGFSALPGGYLIHEDGLYGVGETGRWWTVSPNRYDTIPNFVKMTNRDDYVNAILSKKYSGSSVRCVADT